MYILIGKQLGQVAPSVEKPLGKQDSTKRDMQKRFTFPIWNLPEAQNATNNSAGSITFKVNGVIIHLLPDRIVTEEEYNKEGNTFKRDKFVAGAQTKFRWVKTHFDPKSVQYVPLGNQWIIGGYKEPTFEISVQVVYRKSRKVPTLEEARRLPSGYGKGKTLREHESWHVADAIDFIRKSKHPTFTTGYTLTIEEFNRNLESYYQAVSSIGKTLEQYSRMTDCTGKRKAPFCQKP